MKVLWHSIAPWAPTGYGVQTALFAKRISELPDVDLAISSGFGLDGSALEWEGVRVYPGDGWSRTAKQWMDHHGQGEPVLVVTLMDVWPLDREIFKAINRDGRLACWVPVDHKPCPSLVREFFSDTGATPIAMSRFGEQELREAGLDPLYVPHGVDTNVFQEYPRDKVREMYGFDKDTFVVGMVGNNQGISPARKGFSEAFIAFSEFHRQHPNSHLFLHTEMTGMRNGVNIVRLLERFEIPPEAVGFTNQVRMEEGILPNAMASLYSSFDVLLNASYGEGFGVPIVEAQACGTPVIVTDWTAMPELCGAGWKVGGMLWDDVKHDAFFRAPDVGEILAALEQAYEHRGDQALRAQAREFALGYDADKVMADHWMPALEQLSQPREVKPLRPNRDLTRRKATAAS